MCRGTDLGKGTKNNSAALKVHKNMMVSILLKWKKFITTNTFPRAGCPSKMSNSSSVEMGGQPSLQHSTKSGLHGSRVGRRKPLLSKKKAHDSPLGVWQKAPKGISDHEKQDSMV
jgi:hypothetical protein